MNNTGNIYWIGKETEGNQRFSDVPYMAYLSEANRRGRRVLRKFTLLELAFVIMLTEVLDGKLVRLFRDLSDISDRT